MGKLLEIFLLFRPWKLCSCCCITISRKNFDAEKTVMVIIFFKKFQYFVIFHIVKTPNITPSIFKEQELRKKRGLQIDSIFGLHIIRNNKKKTEISEKLYIPLKKRSDISHPPRSVLVPCEGEVQSPKPKMPTKNECDSKIWSQKRCSPNR